MACDHVLLAPRKDSTTTHHTLPAAVHFTNHFLRIPQLLQTTVRAINNGLSLPSYTHTGNQRPSRSRQSMHRFLLSRSLTRCTLLFVQQAEVITKSRTAHCYRNVQCANQAVQSPGPGSARLTPRPA
jgi:hypothetical protein